MNAYCYRFISGYASAKFTPNYMRHGGQYKSHWRPAATLVSMEVVSLVDCLHCGSIFQSILHTKTGSFQSHSHYGDENNIIFPFLCNE